MEMKNMSLKMNTFLLVLLCLRVQLSLSDPSKCSDDENTCVCKTHEGTIDLQPLSSTSTETPRFQGLVHGDFTYGYNPCQPYFDSSECAANSGVYACQVETDNPNNAYAIAQDTTEAIYVDGDDIYVHYTGSQADNGEQRETRVHLVCLKDATSDSEPVITTAGDDVNSLHYEFTIQGCQVCPGGCSKASLSAGVAPGIVGIVLIMLVPCVFVAYFIVGAVIMKVKYQATGSDIIPNKAFWVALPGLIKDGCGCTFGPPFRFIRGKIKGGDGQGYESMKD